MNISSLIKYFKNIRDQYDEHHISAQQAVTDVHKKYKVEFNNLNMNIDNYLYRNGIFNRATALKDAKDNKMDDEIDMVKHSHQQWFSNYGLPSQSHDLIKADLAPWKVDAALNSMIIDLELGSYNEGSAKDLQIEE